MDKKTAFKILNLKTGVSFAEAKKAYRNLAKKNHPDVAAKKNQQKISADTKMKEINLAFRYLAPRLRSNKAVKKTVKEKKVNPPVKNVKAAYLTKIIRVLFSIFRGEKGAGPFKKNVKKEELLRKAKGKTIRFDEVFNRVYQDHFNEERKTNRYKNKRYSKKNHSYNRYQEYMVLKRKMKSGRSDSNQDISMGRIDQIDPVKPVKSVGRI